MSTPFRLAFVVSHPVQYYVPLYQRLAKRTDIEIKIFYTWHAALGRTRASDARVAWDIPRRLRMELGAGPCHLKKSGLERARCVTGAWWSRPPLRASQRRVPAAIARDCAAGSARGPVTRLACEAAVLRRIYCMRAFLCVVPAARVLRGLRCFPALHYCPPRSTSRASPPTTGKARNGGAGVARGSASPTRPPRATAPASSSESSHADARRSPAADTRTHSPDERRPARRRGRHLRRAIHDGARAVHQPVAHAIGLPDGRRRPLLGAP